MTTTDSSMAMAGLDRDEFFRVFTLLVTAFLAGFLVSVKPDLSPNDAARWDTIWSLVEYGDYQIYDTLEDAEKFGRPMQIPTIDKVVKDGRTYASKPPLLPTLIAGWVKAVRFVVGKEFSKDTPVVGGPAIRGSIHLYAKAALFLFQLVPFVAFLFVFRRLMDKAAPGPAGDFVWLFGLIAGAIGTLNTGYLSTLNNHVQASYFGFFATYLAMTIWFEGRREAWRFLVCGLCAGWTACNEFPAALLVVACFGALLLCDGKKTILLFVPAVAAWAAALLTTNYLAVGSIVPAYLQRELYEFPGGYWSSTGNRSGIDALNDHPESYLVYFLHMTIGHHGIFSLTPIFLYSVIGGWRNATKRDARWRGIVWPILVVSAGVFAFYWIVNNQRNYGGFCHGMRWVMWLGPLWLILLPSGLEEATSSRGSRRLAWLLLAVSVFSMADTIYNPWTRAWLQRLMIGAGIIDY